jgi:hypothetical protein
MPLLYGEEEKAFRRLQEEIIKCTPDLSIFAWTSPATYLKDVPEHQIYCSVLAEAPNHFSWCRETQLCIRPLKHGIPVSNNHVKIYSRLIACKRQGDRQLWQYVLPIHHYRSPSRDVGSLGIQLRKVGEDQFLRKCPWQLFDTDGHRYFDCAGTHQLLLTPPWLHTVHPTHPLSSNWISEEYLWRLRPSTIRFRLDRNMESRSFCPEARYDNEDELFFVADEYDHNDWGILGLSAELESDDATQLRPLFIEFTMCTVFWGEDSRPQCSILPQNIYAMEIKALKSHMSARRGDRDYLLHFLIHNDIPRVVQSSVDVPGTNATAIIRFTCTERKSRREASILHGGSAWDVRITCTLYERGEEPGAPEATKWQLR